MTTVRTNSHDADSATESASATDSATFDAAHVWHPYGPMPSPVRALPVASAAGT